MNERVSPVLREVKKVIVGKDEVLQKVLMAVLADGHVLLEDVPGVGKTNLALAFSKAMGLSFKRVQFTPDTLASDISGFSVWNKASGAFEFKPGAVFCNFFLADEINRTGAKTQAALLEVMEERKVTVDGKTYLMQDPFVCVATQNPLGSAGTHSLPDSQLDRFMVRLSLGYPTVEEQVEIVKQRENGNPLQSVQAVLTATELKAMKQEVNAVYMEDSLIQYASKLCEATRSAEGVAQGVSPRAVLALVQMAKASAYMNGRDYCIPSDLSSLFCDVCAHRLLLTPKAKMRGVSPEQILTGLLHAIKAPSPADRR